jgi:hypothetical protein
MSQPQTQRQDQSDAVIRFNISSHLRGAETEIDGLHGKLLMAQNEIAELGKKLEAALKTIEELKPKEIEKKVKA